MANKILLAVDESKNSMNAVKYVAKTMRPDSVITVLSILPDATAACGMDSPSLTPVFNQNKEAFCAIEDAKRLTIQGFMKEARDVLIAAGFDAKNVNTKILKKRSGIARDIIRQARQGDYDSIVVGRRGLSGIKEFLFGSISNKILNMAVKTTVVLVG